MPAANVMLGGDQPLLVMIRADAVNAVLGQWAVDGEQRQLGDFQSVGKTIIEDDADGALRVGFVKQVEILKIDQLDGVMAVGKYCEISEVITLTYPTGSCGFRRPVISAIQGCWSFGTNPSWRLAICTRRRSAGSTFGC